MAAQPTVGRIVHVFHGDSERPVAAIVAGVNANGSIDVVTFPPRQQPSQHWDLTEKPNDDGVRWSWPPREQSDEERKERKAEAKEAADKAKADAATKVIDKQGAGAGQQQPPAQQQSGQQPQT